jgi:hypothetical protein
VKPDTVEVLKKLFGHDRKGLGSGLCLDNTPGRREALRAGWIYGRPMKVGHRKMYYLTSQGREFDL